jgi:hypothetical protein
MCPESERYMREVKKSIHFYECDPKGQMIHAKMVKDYSRSAADQVKFSLSLIKMKKKWIEK